MERDLKYVSPAYREQLDNLAETLRVQTRDRYLADRALDDTVEFPLVTPDNIVVGEE